MQKIKKLATVLALVALFFLLLLPLFSCSAGKEIILASTTSTQDSGLFDAILPVFEKETGYTVKVIAVGTGEAIELGKKGEADVILVHSRKAEDAFVKEGYGVGRKDVMHNDFLIVGPKGDPAGISAMGSVAEALMAISAGKFLFVSRGDGSGTHKKELAAWENSGIDLEGNWYIETGQGMGETLRIAEEKQGHTLTDRGTWLAQKDNFTLVELFWGDKALFNPYGVIAVNPEKHPGLKINYDGAIEFIKWITGEQAQAIIKEFGIDKYGEPLFYPDAVK